MYGGMDSSMTARMKGLEVENARFKKIYIEENLKAEILNEVISQT
jgi:putative transposase